MKDEVFKDIRAPQGDQLLMKKTLSPTQNISKVNATNIGFALSPLAQRGQQVVALGKSARRKQVAQSKTPLSKLLNSNEMAEF